MKAAIVSVRDNRFIVMALGALAALHYAIPAGAQPAGANSKFKYSANKLSRDPNGDVRLEGKARIQSPEIDVAAQTIVFGIVGNQITQVRAQNKVTFKLDPPAKNGGAPTHIEASCDTATLKPAERTLLLNGNVNGWFRMAGGARNTLSGESATLTFAEKNLMAEVNGGTRGVNIVIPAEETANPAAIGSVTLTSQRATFNGTDGTARFSGKARAVSTDGPNKFDVAAPEFVLTRGEKDTIDKLTTVGRTRFKIDLPREAAPTAVAPATVAAAPAAGAPDVIPEVGRPTHLEAEADNVTMRRSDNTMNFQGNVKGFYELATPGAPATKYDFSGERVDIKYVTQEEAKTNPPQGLKVEMSGGVEIIAPGLNLNF